MPNETPSLVTLADRILIPAVSLTELPDLTIEPSKVQEMILDYISEQDCPGALAHLQRELGRATRRPHCAHSTSRLVQLVAKGLLYEKNTPRLDSILQGCNSIMRSLENESQDHQAIVVSSELEDQQQSTSHPTLNSHNQARQSSVSQPRLRDPDASHTQLALHHHADLSTEPKRGRMGQCSSKLEQPSFPQAGVCNLLLPPFSASTCGPEAGSSSLSASGLLARQNYHDHLIQSNVNRGFSSYLRASASLGDAPRSFKHIASPTLDPTPSLLNSNINSIITAQPLDKDSHPSNLPSKSQLNLDGSLSPRHTFMPHENKANQAQPNSHALLPSTDPLDTSPLPSGLRDRWHIIGDTDEIMCLDTDGCPAPELISAPVSNAHHSRRNELPDVKPNLSQRYGHESAVPDSTLTHLSPRRSSTKRSRAIPSAQPSPPTKRSRPDLASPPGKGPSNPISPNRSLFTSPNNVMLYDLSDADLPGTPPEVSPHISWQAIPDLSQGNIGTQNHDDAHTENTFMEPEPPRDLSDVGTPRGSPSSAVELNIPTKAPLASSSKVLTPPVMITEDNIDSAHHGTLAELHSSTLLGPQTHTFTTVCDSGPDATNQETTSTCQVLQPNMASESSTPSAIMIELRAKLFASRKPRPPVAPVAPVVPVAPVAPVAPVVPAVPVAPAASVAPVPPQVLGLQVPSAEPPPLPSLSLEQNLKAHLKSRQGASPASQSQAGATEELEDGQISTPPPEENPSRPKLPPPTIKHPLPPKPDFLSSSSNYQHKANLNPSTCFLPPLPVPSPMDGTLSHSNGISIFNFATPQPMRSSNPTIVQNPQLGPPPSIIAQPTKVTHIAHLPAKVSQNGQEWQDLKERKAQLKVHLARLRADPATRQVQRSTSSQGSLGQNGTSAPTSSSSHSIAQNLPKSPVFDVAKRHDRPSALDTFNLSQTDLKSPSSASPANFTQPPECLVNTPAPRHVDDFFTSLQEQLDSNVKQLEPIHSTSVLKSVSEDSPRSSLSLTVHQVSQLQESESGLDTLRQSSTVEARTLSPSESAVSTAESSVEIFLADNPEEIVSIDATAPDSGSYLRDERLAQLADHPSTIPSLSKGQLDHSVCKCKDLNCIVGHCSSAAQHGALTTCYRASDVRDAPCPKPHSRVPTPAPMSTTNQSNTFWNNQLCRYDMQCLRQDCHFRHTWQKQHSTSSKVSASLPKRGSEAESTSHASNISASIPIITPHSTLDGDTIRTISNQSLRHVPSPAPDKSQELIASSSSTTLSYSLRETRPAALQITLNDNLTTQAFPTTGSPVIENPPASQSHSSTSSGPWSVADQLEQYANPARGLRDWARQSDDSVLHLSPRISSPMLLPDPNVPLSSSMNNFSPILPSYSPQCFELARPVPLPPRPSHSAFLSFDDADATSLPTVPLPSSTSGLSSHPSSSTFPQPLPSESPIQPIISVTHNDTHKRSDSHPTRSLPTGPSSRPIPSVANPVREERRTKSGKLRNPSNPNNLLVPPILNDLLLGVKKVGQQQIQSDLDLMNQRDPGGDQSEHIGTAVLSSLGWTSYPDRSKCKAVNPAASRTFLQQSNLPIPIGLENEKDIRRMWTEVFEHPLTKNVYRYCQELKFGGLKRGRDEEEGKNPRIDNLKNALVIPVKIIGFIANGGRRWPKRKSR